MVEWDLKENPYVDVKFVAVLLRSTLCALRVYLRVRVCMKLATGAMVSSSIGDPHSHA